MKQIPAEKLRRAPTFLPFCHLSRTYSINTFPHTMRPRDQTVCEGTGDCSGNTSRFLVRNSYVNFERTCSTFFFEENKSSGSDGRLGGPHGDLLSRRVMSLRHLVSYRGRAPRQRGLQVHDTLFDLVILYNLEFFPTTPRSVSNPRRNNLSLRIPFPPPLYRRQFVSLIAPKTSWPMDEEVIASSLS